MSTSSFTEFKLPRNAYAAFDALSIKQLITNRLKTMNVFPDIDYEGSNINGLVDVVAYTYHVLLFYLNQTAADATFSQAELFENMNKIVSLIGYKPTGNHTSALKINMYGTVGLAVGSYSIQRFSYIIINNIYYSFNKDISFQKTTYSIADEYIESVGMNNLLYQGTFKEYPLYSAIGENFEVFTLNINYPLDSSSNKMIDHDNIFIYVQDIETEKWTEWKEINSLYLSDNVSKVFEKKLNEYGHYEIKFGDNINGRRLNPRDKIAIFYLESDSANGMVGVNSSKEGKIQIYKSSLFDQIFKDIKDENSNYLTRDDSLTLKFDNEYASIPPTTMETVGEIRKNAPLLFSSQNRAVTTYDYESYVVKNFANIIQSVKTVSNKQYTSEYLSYFYELGLERPNLDDKMLFNQVSFNDACDFNNVYLFCVPKYGAIQNETTPIDLFFAQKQILVDKLNTVKMINHNIVVSDPVYVAFDIGLPTLNEIITSNIRNESIIRITRSPNQVISKDQVKNTIFNLIKQFFAQENNELGQLLNLTNLSFNILNIEGIKSLETVRMVGNVEYKTPNISFIYWNPLYSSANINTTAQNMNLNFYQFPFFYEITNLINKIEII